MKACGKCFKLCPTGFKSALIVVTNSTIGGCLVNRI